MNDPETGNPRLWIEHGDAQQALHPMVLAARCVADLAGHVRVPRSARPVLDNSPYSDKMLHGFDCRVMFNFCASRVRLDRYGEPGRCFFAVLFFLMTALFLPGVFPGYASTYRLPVKISFVPADAICGDSFAS